jgi:hypothetical protein
MPRRELRGTDAFYTLIGTKERAGARSMGARRDQSAIAQSCTKKKDNVTKIFPPFMPRAYPTTEKKGSTESWGAVKIKLKRRFTTIAECVFGKSCPMLLQSN